MSNKRIYDAVADGIRDALELSTGSGAGTKADGVALTTLCIAKRLHVIPHGFKAELFFENCGLQDLSAEFAKQYPPRKPAK